MTDGKPQNSEAFVKYVDAAYELAFKTTMEPLGCEFNKILYDNLWELYERDIDLDADVAKYCAKENSR